MNANDPRRPPDRADGAGPPSGERPAADVPAPNAAGVLSDDAVAMLVHDFRSPLNAITGYVQLLEMETAGPLTATQRGYLRRIGVAGRQLLEQTDHLLDYAKAQAGLLHVEEVRSSARGALEAALALVRPQALAARVELSVRFEAEPEPWYVGDPGRVRQILVNLLANAVRFSPAGGQVWVICGTSEREDRPWTFIRVRDRGPGIPAEQIARIFEPYVQGDAGTERARRGTGLGLTVSRRFARLMGGDVIAESEPGEGATFTLWLPLATAPEAEEVPEDAADAVELAVRGVARIGWVLTTSLPRIMEDFARRLRTLPLSALVADFSDMLLMDHQTILLADIAQALVMAEELPGAARDLISDGSLLQRVIAQRHALQRVRLGWSEDDLRAEYALFTEVVRQAAERAGAADPDADLAAALEILDGLLAQARQVSSQTFRDARGPAA